MSMCSRKQNRSMLPVDTFFFFLRTRLVLMVQTLSSLCGQLSKRQKLLDENENERAFQSCFVILTV